MDARPTCVVLLVVCGLTAAQTPVPPAANERTGPDEASERHAADVDPVENVSRALRETDLPTNSIIVSKHGDTVVLTGRVGNSAEAARAAAIARAAAADARVIDEIEVPPPQRTEDQPAAASEETAGDFQL